VCGRVFTEGLREESSNMFYQELVVRGKPLHRSIVPFEGTTAKGTIEFYYSQSEQRPGKFVQLAGDRYSLISAHPDYDVAWFRNLTDTEAAELESREP
jgi:molecular chaperone Hsp33